MKVLILCEYSGRVRDAFIKRGHQAISVDLLQTESDGPHWQGDALYYLATIAPEELFDLMIAFPPCTYVASSGLHWNHRIPGRAEKTEEALRFIQAILNTKIPKIGLENPVGCISTRIRKPDQIIQPWQFGHDASKRTCLWLKNLPLLMPTKIIQKRRYANQMHNGQSNLPQSAGRAKRRSLTYQGIADAMAGQWGTS